MSTLIIDRPTTQNGVPIIDCTQCGGTHPEPRKHCMSCGRPSLFINPQNLCLNCNPKEA